MMKKMKWLVVLAAVVIIGLVGCSPMLRLDQPTVTGSADPDAIPIYIEPYVVADSTTSLGSGAKWDRDLFIKQAIASRVKARFVESPSAAKITITTVAFKLGHVMKIHSSSTTKFNDIEVKTYIERPDQFFGSPSVMYMELARSDGDIVSSVLEKILRGDVVHEATGLIIIGDEHTYRGMKDVVIK